MFVGLYFTPKKNKFLLLWCFRSTETIFENMQAQSSFCFWFIVLRHVKLEKKYDR